MNDLIERLQNEAGLTPEQSQKALETIKNYIVEKFPMLEGMIGNFLGGEKE